MSRFFNQKYENLIPYTPGEQPRNIEKIIKLNTNESPFPPSPQAVCAAAKEAEHLELYSDPECKFLTEKTAQILNVQPSNVIMTNGSDEALFLAFTAYCDKQQPAAFADITYGFYSVFAQLLGVPYVEIPLKSDFSIDINDYVGIKKTIFIANPNAPTGIALEKDKIETIVCSNPNNIVVIDEAYVDFGAESCISLINKYDNLIVTGTFSKSRSMAGARLGFAVGNREIVNDLNTLKFSMNPYNVNRMTMVAGIGALSDQDYFKNNCRKIINTRNNTVCELKKLGFLTLPSSANFVFATHPKVSGSKIYNELKKRGIFVRHFEKERIQEYNRITIGTDEQMKALLRALSDILREE